MVCATTTSGGTRGESDGQTSQTQIEIQTAHNKAHRATYSVPQRKIFISKNLIIISVCGGPRPWYA